MTLDPHRLPRTQAKMKLPVYIPAELSLPRRANQFEHIERSHAATKIELPRSKFEKPAPSHLTATHPSGTDVIDKKTGFIRAEAGRTDVKGSLLRGANGQLRLVHLDRPRLLSCRRLRHDPSVSEANGVRARRLRRIHTVDDHPIHLRLVGQPRPPSRRGLWQGDLVDIRLMPLI